MPDRHPGPYRFRGNIAPSADVARPVAAYRHQPSNDANSGGGTAATLDILDVIDGAGGFWGIAARDVATALKQVGDIDTLFVRLQSPGGQADEGVAIANLLRAHPATVRATVYGMAASAASYIAAAADRVSMAPGSRLFLHDALMLTIGNADDLRKDIENLDSMSESIASLYALKAGGSAAQWRDVMRAETFYTADQAVEVGLADAVGIDQASGPVETPGGEPAPLDSAFDKVAARFDLSMFRDSAAQSPCSCGENGQSLPRAGAYEHRLTCPQNVMDPESSTDPEEDGSMPDTIPTAGVCRALGLPSDADEATVLAALNQALEERAEPDPTPDPAPAAAVPEGHVVVSQLVLDELRENAAAGREARAQQLREARDEAIDAAVNDGRISRARVDAWRTSWDRDPDGTKADLDSLQPRFPVAQTTGYAGSDQSDGAGTKPFTDEEGDALAALAGLPAGVLR